MYTMAPLWISVWRIDSQKMKWNELTLTVARSCELSEGTLRWWRWTEEGAREQNHLGRCRKAQREIRLVRKVRQKWKPTSGKIKHSEEIKQQCWTSVNQDLVDDISHVETICCWSAQLYWDYDTQRTQNTSVMSRSCHQYQTVCTSHSQRSHTFRFRKKTHQPKKSLSLPQVNRKQH